MVISALLQSFKEPDKWDNPFDQTAGLIFFGTPFRGRNRNLGIDEMVQRIREAHPDAVIWKKTMDMVVPESKIREDLVEGFMNARCI